MTSVNPLLAQVAGWIALGGIALLGGAVGGLITARTLRRWQ